MINSLEIDSVRLLYGDREILNNVYLKAETGRITGLLGRNGSGKSSLLNLIFGMVKGDKSLRINKEPIIGNKRKPKDIRMLPQFNFTPKHMRIIQAFNEFRVDFDEFSNIFKEFGHSPMQRFNELSGVNARIIETYLILKSDSRFCILDEPFLFLSPKYIDILMNIIRIEKDNKGIILTDHLYKNVIELSDELYFAKDCVIHKIDNLEKLEKLGYLS